jgi:putative flavoprotein involved in K+ transport
MTSAIATDLDVLITGAGQAGLATAYALRRSGHTVALVDNHARIGDSWRKRYYSLVLFTPRRYSSLPGLPLDGDPDGFPTKDEIADYLERYCATHAFRVMSGTRIDSLCRRGTIFKAMTSSRRMLRARAVVIATGPFQEPAVPAAARFLPAEVEQWTVDSYRNPAGFAGKRVLVVGDGASGRQIARELAQTTSVSLATGKPRRVMPDRILGKSVFWWLEKLRLNRLPDNTWIGKRFKALDAFPGKHLELAALRRQGVAVVGRLGSLAGNQACFAGGTAARVDAVIWAVGYRDNYDWMDIPEAQRATVK